LLSDFQACWILVLKVIVIALANLDHCELLAVGILFSFVSTRRCVLSPFCTLRLRHSKFISRQCPPLSTLCVFRILFSIILFVVFQIWHLGLFSSSFASTMPNLHHNWWSLQLRFPALNLHGVVLLKPFCASVCGSSESFRSSTK